MAEQLSQSELDYPFKLLEYFDSFMVSKVIFSACELGIFDLLTAPPCALTAQQVAVSCNASVGGTERLLDALVGMELLHVETQEDGTALYSNSEVASMYLAKGGAKSLHHVAIYRSQTGYQLWNNLADAVREGKNQYQKAFGIPPEEVFQAIYRSDKDMLKFMSLMNSCWVLDGHDVVMAFSLAGFRDIVDLGGCTGALAREMTKAYPSSSVTVFDMPAVVEMARKYFLQADDTFAFQSGDFFHDELPVADLYVLARIIHDWSEDKCVNLLKRICDVCRPGGGVLLVEATLLESRRGPVHTQLLSLNMLLQTEGRERPASQYAGLLRRSGFRDVQVCRTGKTYDAILALK
ncbi:acetylserotonin O-methyltransferase 2 isoform X2 [Syngnathoides biaculeatus]|uniref:acetylserotonin O-methyltransferase 2 isoform X2 n=1 Tax=Syngnathoides biaculeatus TaxID=300417 RepID=UPI002ADDD743|nr:acetylserotonin O-methyltransferase 2 isoform X2 [Syngnathoides biaculeatus]